MNAQNPMHFHPQRSRAVSPPVPPLWPAPAGRPVNYAGAPAGVEPGQRRRVPAEQPASPQKLSGPFLREYRPRWPYRHRSAQVVAVLYYRHRRPLAVGPEGEEGYLWRWLRRPYTAFELQLGWHTVSFVAELPAAESGRSFPAEVRVRWQVSDPYRVARSQVTDVAALLVPELEQELRNVSRAFSIDSAENVRDEVHKALRKAELGRDFGLELDVFVTISSDELIQDHGKSMGRVRHQTDLERLNQQLRLLRDENKRTLIRDWATDFQSAIERGDHVLMAQMMARNPKDVMEIRQLFRKEHRKERQDGMELMSRLIDGGLLERWELGEQAMVVVEFLRSNARRLTTDSVPKVPIEGKARRDLFWEGAASGNDAESSGEDAAEPAGDGVDGPGR
ncbi:hypothetical protein ACH4E8_31525 [Streptomyces sp. NPDC017979]|uniref:hypothetical protein n=1 Tax=Streptomyces sp. NPDC017979 TaxID=3365024 RepID=UPI00378EEA87